MIRFRGMHLLQRLSILSYLFFQPETTARVGSLVQRWRKILLLLGIRRIFVPSLFPRAARSSAIILTISAVHPLEGRRQTDESNRTSRLQEVLLRAAAPETAARSRTVLMQITSLAAEPRTPLRRSPEPPLSLRNIGSPCTLVRTRALLLPRLPSCSPGKT